MLSDLLQAFGEIRECSDPRDPLISILDLMEEGEAERVADQHDESV
jgi:hypothetical protein